MNDHPSGWKSGEMLNSGVGGSEAAVVNMIKPEQHEAEHVDDMIE